MRLSEAMMLGDAMLPRNDGYSWFGGDDGLGEDCGCAMGRAWLASGRSVKEWLFLRESNGWFGFAAEWPWMAEKQTMISSYFLSVISREMTFEQLVDYVRSIEPECGDCNQFACACQHTEQIEASSPLCIPCGSGEGR